MHILPLLKIFVTVVNSHHWLKQLHFQLYQANRYASMGSIFGCRTSIVIWFSKGTAKEEMQLLKHEQILSHHEQLLEFTILKYERDER